jgi:hypothetical protein
MAETECEAMMNRYQSDAKHFPVRVDSLIRLDFFKVNSSATAKHENL